MKTLIGILLVVLATLGSSHYFLFSESRLFTNTPFWQQDNFKKSELIKKELSLLQQGQLNEKIKTYLPVLWWHPDEKFKSSDPASVFSKSEIWFKQLSSILPFISVREVKVAKITDSSWKSVEFENFKPVDVVSRLHESKGLNKGYSGFELRYDINEEQPENPPLMWRLSKHPVFEKIQTENPQEMFLPLEIWYFSAYNYTDIHFGFHDGDWESMLVLFKVTDIDNSLSFSVALISLSAHGHTVWHCPKNFNYVDSHFEVFSALGTHATYKDEGVHLRIYPDRTGKGTAWQTWNNTRSLYNEPYYGFSGSWGRTSYVEFQNGPIAPGPDFKYLPREMNLEKAVQQIKQAYENCLP